MINGIWNATFVTVDLVLFTGYVPCLFLSPVGSVVPGAGAFEVAVNAALTEFKKSVKGRARLGVQVGYGTLDMRWLHNQWGPHLIFNKHKWNTETSKHVQLASWMKLYAFKSRETEF